MMHVVHDFKLKTSQLVLHGDPLKRKFIDVLDIYH